MLTLNVKAFMSSRHRIKYSSIVVLAFISQSAVADGFALFSKHEELKGHVVVDAGDFEKMDPPIGRIGVGEVLKLNANCFQPTGSLGSWLFSKKAGFVLVNRSRAIRIAFLESSIGSIKIETMLASQIACPSEDPSGLRVDPRQEVLELKRQRELLQLQLERWRQQQQK